MNTLCWTTSYEPCIQLWMGTHPSSPSTVTSSGVTLSDHLAANPQLVGVPVVERFSVSDGSLPFLFKVLSIQKALSIQAHPDKRTAEKLHASSPQVYKGPPFFSDRSSHSHSNHGVANQMPIINQNWRSL